MGPDTLQVHSANEELRRVNAVTVVDQEKVFISTGHGLLMMNDHGKRSGMDESPTSLKSDHNAVGHLCGGCSKRPDEGIAVGENR